MKKRIVLNLNDTYNTALIARALSAEIRLMILKLLIRKSCNLSEIAKEINIPMSSAALHVKILEKANLILAQEFPGARGTQKVCGIAFEDVYFNVFEHLHNGNNVKEVSIEMPIGNYFDCQVTSPCGIVSAKEYLGCEDSPCAFYSSDRLHAQLIWFECGFLEYRFATNILKNITFSELKFDFEVCSEAPGYNANWPSDITVWVNGIEVETIHSKGDFGDRKGINNPDWWSLSQTQYGILRNVLINSQGCYDNSVKCSSVTLDMLNLMDNYYISFKIGVKPNADNVGGMNLFGKNFGDHPFGIVMTVIY